MIWLIGNKGMLGTEVAKALARAGAKYVGSDRDVDILELKAIATFAEGKGIESIINCAAYTAVDKAEDESELACAINADGPGNLATVAKSIGARLVHVSTDYVFDGSSTRPYTESDPVAPTGVYGRTKAEGEERVRSSCPEHVIVRTAWLYGMAGNNFVSTMLRLMASKARVGVVADQKGTPTYAVDLAKALVAIALSSAPSYGTFHYSNLGETTWHGFALEIQRLGLESGLLKTACVVDPLTTEQYPTKTKRPAYSVLSKDKIMAAYGLDIPEWKTSLKEYFSELLT